VESNVNEEIAIDWPIAQTLKSDFTYVPSFANFLYRTLPNTNPVASKQGLFELQLRASQLEKLLDVQVFFRHGDPADKLS
jgi:hypothetical protein